MVVEECGEARESEERAQVSEGVLGSPPHGALSDSGEGDEGGPLRNYLAKDNETPEEIARWHGVAVSQVMQLNKGRYSGLTQSSRLEENTSILLPSKAERTIGAPARCSAAPSPSERSRADEQAGVRQIVGERREYLVQARAGGQGDQWATRKWTAERD